jgi:hypothetical protein
MKHITPNKRLAAGLLAALTITSLLSAGSAHAQKEDDPCGSDGLNESDECEGGGSVVLDEVVVVGDPLPDPPGSTPGPPPGPIGPVDPDWNDAGGGGYGGRGEPRPSCRTIMQRRQAIESEIGASEWLIGQMQSSQATLDAEDAALADQVFWAEVVLSYRERELRDVEANMNQLLSGLEEGEVMFVRHGTQMYFEDVEVGDKPRPVRLFVTAELRELHDQYTSYEPSLRAAQDNKQVALADRERARRHSTEKHDQATAARYFLNQEVAKRDGLLTSLNELYIPDYC